MEKHVYKITNKLNGKAYIGQTVSLDGRFKNHFYDNTDFSKEMQKYGKENFIIESLYFGSDYNQVEADMIIEHNTLYPNGYNKETGGISGYTLCKDSRRKIGKSFNRTSEQMKALRSKQIITDEHKAKISKTLTGVPKSEQARINMSKPRGEQFKETCKIAQKKRLEDGYVPMKGSSIGTSKLNDDKVMFIIQYIKDHGYSKPVLNQLSNKFDVTVANLRMIHNNKSWKHIPR